MKPELKEIIIAEAPLKLKAVAGKILDGQRINSDEALLLFHEADLSLLSVMATEAKRKISNDDIYFNRNFHIEPTNICAFNCRFCSFHKGAGEAGSWELSVDEMLNIVRRYENISVTEVHITGGAHPAHDIYYYTDLISQIKKLRPDISIKAFSAIELTYMIKKAGMTFTQGLQLLKDNGLDSIPGGGAEIFDESLRKIICGEKAGSDDYLAIHEAAHKLGLPSNATMLYGHSENHEQRIDHLSRLRNLQDRTGGFNAFIPLKFRNENNSMSYLPEVPVTEDMRNYAVSRIFLDNIPHLKAYWPAIGRDMAVMSLAFGVDDLDGTIDDTTRIYSMAGAEDTNPSMTDELLTSMIRSAGFHPVERDTHYRPIKEG